MVTFPVSVQKRQMIAPPANRCCFSVCMVDNVFPFIVLISQAAKSLNCDVVPVDVPEELAGVMPPLLVRWDSKMGLRRGFFEAKALFPYSER